MTRLNSRLNAKQSFWFQIHEHLEKYLKLKSKFPFSISKIVCKFFTTFIFFLHISITCLKKLHVLSWINKRIYRSGYYWESKFLFGLLILSLLKGFWIIEVKQHAFIWPDTLCISNKKQCFGVTDKRICVCVLCDTQMLQIHSFEHSLHEQFSFPFIILLVAVFRFDYWTMRCTVKNPQILCITFWSLRWLHECICFQSHSEDKFLICIIIVKEIIATATSQRCSNTIFTWPIDPFLGHFQIAISF